MKFFGLESIPLALGLAGLAQAHMEMTYPAPFKSKANPNAGQDIDYSMTAPLDASGANFPCKGYHSLMGTPAGKSTADWTAGETYKMTINGGANHNGGSCQASLSFDSGKTWSVIHSYVGNCPLSGSSDFGFKVPSDTPNGDALFAWTWFNLVGNREMYMNCAVVTITGGASEGAKTLSNRPAMFVANVGNGCTTKEGSDLAFPDPGADVSSASSKTDPPQGSCASGGGGNNGGGDNGEGNNGGGDNGEGNNGDGDNGEGNNGGGENGEGNNGDGGNGEGNNGGSPVPSVTQPAPSVTQPATTAVPPSSTIPGGVFITVSQPATKPANPVPTNSTLLTVTKTTPGGGNQSPTEVVPPPEPTTPSTGTQDPGSACTNEGEWNCIAGTQYQRCASGLWTVVQPMAAGTTCDGNRSMNFAWGFGKRSHRAGRRFVGIGRV